MKKMKKYIALVLCLLMFCSVSLEVFAEEGSTVESSASGENWESVVEIQPEEDNEANGCSECGMEEGHAENCSLYVDESAKNVLLQNMLAAESVAEIYSLITSADESVRSALAQEDINTIFERIDELDPEGDDADTEALVDLLVNLPCFISGQEEEGENAGTYAGTIIYFDLAAGDVKINYKGDGNYSGYKYNSNGAIVSVTGKHSNDNEYYIYQSINGKGNGTIPTYTRVKHPTDSSKTWADYITNHPGKSNAGRDSVDEVIHAWGETVHRGTASINSGAASAEGRTPTPYHVYIQGAVGMTFNVTVDNVWSSFFGDTGGTAHESGITYMIPAGDGNTNTNININNTLNLYFKGDNRLTRIHAATHDGTNGNYHDDKGNTNKLNITGDSDATLTIANGLTNTRTMWTAAAIGGTDSNDHSVVMNIQNITLYAGNGEYDYGAAIGGGGNGFGYVTIEGNATVTAICSSTGAAIGGGCGTSGPGGKGVVTINSGNVYAYNYIPFQISTATSTFTTDEYGRITSCTETKSWSDAIPTAIGGGSSGAQIGGYGEVTITGGEVFAYSEVGNAIGGGGGGKGNYQEKTDKYVKDNVRYTTSAGTQVKAAGGELKYKDHYMNATGGDAKITISGGTIKAISTGTAIGGGPGGGAAYDWYKADGGQGLPTRWIDVGNVLTNEKVSSNGGTCELEITGGKIYTGSIGGGTPKYEGDSDINKWGFTIGAAQVDVSDGYLHGQVVMEGEGSYFNMTGGEINNTPQTNTTDEGYLERYNYKFVKNNGGAVYVKTGNATISGGMIQNTTTRNDGKGGAIYVSGGSVTISGGTIQNAITAEYGGAVCVEGGNFAMTSGTIQNCTAAKDGGAVYVNGGTVTVGLSTCNGTETTHDDQGVQKNHPVLKNNTAVNGGAIAVTTGTPVMYCGDFSSNTASQNGGAVYVASGGFTMNGGNITGGLGEDEINATLGGAIYVAGGNFVLNNGTLSGNNANAGGAVYVTKIESVKGYIIMNGGTMQENSALNGGAAYVDGGDFTMVSGTLSGNTALEVTPGGAEGGTEGYGGAVYAASGDIYIGIEHCNGKDTNHSVEPTGLAHPAITDNTAEFGGALAVNGGIVYIYCGDMTGNKSDNDGTGMNVFMTGEASKIYHYLESAIIGEETNHGMVSVGGELTIVHGNNNQFIITITYFSNKIKDDKGVEITWVGTAPDGYYLNLPYCPENWQNIQDGKGNVFVGWAESAIGTQPGEIRDKGDYHSIGTPIMMEDLVSDGDDTNGGNINFYAVWAPKVNDISYAYVINGTSIEQSNVYDNSSYITKYDAPETYEFNMTSDKIVLEDPSWLGYEFKGWLMYADHDKIANWSADPTMNPYDKQPTTKDQLPGQLFKGEIATIQNFGDITLVAVFEPIYTVLDIEVDGYNTLDENQAYLYHVQSNELYADHFEDERYTVDMVVTVYGEGPTTLTNLPMGKYTVTQLTDWSWRYGVTDVSAAVDQAETYADSAVNFELLQTAETVTFTNERQMTKWLSGDSWSEWLNGLQTLVGKSN